MVHVSSRISGWGMCVPDRVITNSYFESYLDTSDEWIRERTGIQERRWCEPDQATSDIAAPAGAMAIERASLSRDDIDGIVCATVSPDYPFPSTACMIQKKLGLRNCLAFDISAACTGFLYALVTADGLIRSGQCNHVLVVGAEVFSSLINMQDRTTCVLFGDGAGAVVLSRVAEAEQTGSALSLRGLYTSALYADGTKGDFLKVKQGTADRLSADKIAHNEHCLTMEGREVFKFAVRALADVTTTVLERVGMSVDDVDLIVSHQANQRILSSMAKQLGAPESKVPSNVQKYGNTSAASIPILLSELAESGQIKAGSLILLNAVGGGMTWGAAVLRW